MRNDDNNSEHLKKIQDYCNELSNTFAKLSLEIGELVDANEGGTESQVLPSAVISAVEEHIEAAEAVKQAIAPVKTSNKTRKLKNNKPKLLHLFKSPSGEFQVGYRVRITNHYKGRYGDLFNKIGKVESVGKSFIFFRLPNIPVLQQRSARNLQLIQEE